MITVKVKKLYQSKISIRDYEVRGAIKKNEPILVKMDTGETMLLSVFDLRARGIKQGFDFKSRYDNLHYDLIDYPWVPNNPGLFEN